MVITDIVTAMRAGGIAPVVPAGFAVTCGPGGFTKKPAPSVAPTWSHYADERGECVLEGDLFAPAWRDWPDADKGLAVRLLDRVLSRGIDCVDDLNGNFSGAVYSRSERRLWLFVDRLGARFLYYRAMADQCEAATSVYELGGDMRVDPLALNEQLIIGFPLASKTLFAGVALVPPGSIVEWSNGTVRTHRYTRIPERLRRQRPVDGAAMVCESLDRHMATGPETCSIGLSGGKDSRVVLASLLRTGRRPVALTFGTGGDVENASRLAAAVGLSSTQLSIEDASAFETDAALLGDGYGVGWGYLGLAAAAALEPSRSVIFTGFSGDYLSGAWGSVVPWRARSVDELAMMELRARGLEVRPEVATACLAPEYRVDYDDVREAFVESFRRQYAETPDMLTTYLLHRTAHRNRRRIAPLFHSMRGLCNPRHPFTDRDVVNAYLSLPPASLLGQGAHSLAAMCGAPLLGTIPTGDFWAPLALEVRLRSWLRIGKALRSRFARHRPTATWWSATLRRINIACESPLYDPLALARRLGDPEVVIAVDKMAATALHVARMTGATLPSARVASIISSEARP
jgi:hypothetical protein